MGHCILPVICSWIFRTDFPLRFRNNSIPRFLNPGNIPVGAVLFDIGNVLLKFDFDRAARAMEELSTASAREIRAVLDSWQHRHETGAVSSDNFSETVRTIIGFTGPEAVFHQQFCDIFTPNEPMWKFARSLFGKTPVYLFSNISRWHETWVFERYPEFAMFDGGFYSWRIGAMKPDAAFYLEAVQSLPFAPDEIAYMDDMPHNVAGGIAAGFHTVQYNSDRHDDFLTAAQSWFEPVV